MHLLKDIFEDDDINSQVYKLKEGKRLVKEYIENKLIFEGKDLKGEKMAKGKNIIDTIS